MQDREDSGQGDYDFDESRSTETEGEKRLRQTLLCGKPATMTYMGSMVDETGRYNEEYGLFAVQTGERTFAYTVTPYKHGTHTYLMVLGRSVIGEVILTKDGE
jgi:hypothetical protein